MTTQQSVSTEEARYFDLSAEVYKLFWFMAGFPIVLGLIVLASTIKIAINRAGDDYPFYYGSMMGDTIAQVFLGLLLIVAGLAEICFWVWSARHKALDQCQLIARLYQIELEPKDFHDFALRLNAGDVFWNFYSIVKERRPELIKEGFLEGSGGEGWTASRRLVESLWANWENFQNASPTQPSQNIAASEAPAT